MNGVVEDISLLCRGEPTQLKSWIRSGRTQISFLVGSIILCGGIYGFTLGILRSPEQAIYAAIKFPILIFATVFFNALLNGMLAMMLGVQLRMEESIRAVLMSFSIACLFLASLGPVFFFHLWNWSPSDQGNSFFYWKLYHIAMIALAGIIGNVRLLNLLVAVAGHAKGQALLFSWLLANLFLGCQLSWILRPFFGNPNIEVSFFREDALERSFYEDFWVTFQGLMNQFS